MRAIYERCSFDLLGEEVQRGGVHAATLRRLITQAIAHIQPYHAAAAHVIYYTKLAYACEY